MKEQAPKEIKSPQGLIYRLKRPLYKQGLFWLSLIASVLTLTLALVVLGLVIVNGSLSEENARLGGRSDAKSYYYDYGKKLESHAFGESVTFKNGAKVTVSSIETDSQRKMSDEATGQAIVAHVRVENTSNHRLLINPYAFELYDEDGSYYVLDGSTFDNTQIGANLAAGKKLDLELIFDGEKEDNDAYHLAYEQAEWTKETEDSSSDSSVKSSK